MFTLTVCDFCMLLKFSKLKVFFICILTLFVGKLDGQLACCSILVKQRMKVVVLFLTVRK